MDKKTDTQKGHTYLSKYLKHDITLLTLVLVHVQIEDMSDI